MMESQFILGDCFDILPTFPDQSFDSVISDVPYGINLDKWDKPIDIEQFTNLILPLFKEFYAFFGQMPTVTDWINVASKYLKYKEHIVWAKRNTTPLGSGLSRTHESIYVYKKNKANFYTTRGLWSDVQCPHVLTETLSYSSIQRRLSHYEQWIKTGKQPKNFNKQSKVFKHLKPIENNTISTDVNFSNLWSFATPGREIGRWQKGIFYHPCEKSIPLLKRLIELTTPENAIILDPFAGSGTLAIAALETGRRYVCIEKEVEYYDIAMRRIEEWHNTPRQQELDLG